MHSPASKIDKDPYEVKCHIRAQCGGGGAATGDVPPKNGLKRHFATLYFFIFGEGPFSASILVRGVAQAQKLSGEAI